jgi:hypothetical protein
MISRDPRPLVKPAYARVAGPHECQRCFGPLGVRLDRTCTWNEELRIWVDACWSCAREIARESSDYRRHGKGGRA